MCKVEGHIVLPYSITIVRTDLTKGCMLYILIQNMCKASVQNC